VEATDLEACVVRVENARGRTIGTGFLVRPDLVVTCVHVVEAAGACPGKRVRLAFHVGGEPAEAEVLPKGWQPEKDVAFLRVVGVLPEGTHPATLGPAHGSNGHPYQALGYPADGPALARWPQAKIGGLVPVQGWPIRLLQVQGPEVDRGLSGAPVLDIVTGRVVGMITRYRDMRRPEEEDAPRVRYAYAIPAETVQALCPEPLELHPPEKPEEPSGECSISIGGQAIHSILITGDHNRVFVGDYERLRDAYIPPWSVFERVKLDRFVGREWLTAEVDAFLRDNDRGLFVLEAAAGLGKTTFLAHLVKTQGYIHHFVELAPGDDATGLRNLAAQLVRAWLLDPHQAEGVLPGSAARPHFLLNLLFEAARKRDEVRPGEQIVLVVDGLDEAGTPPGQNVLGLPRVLPQGVYLIISQRPVAVTLRVEGPRRVFRLEAQSEKNRADMRAYLEAAATWSGVARALAEQGYAREQFVAALLEKCRGVWIYLHYVVGEIERGERSPLDLATLPEGVWQYYAQYWSRWRDDPRWYTDYLPLLSTLAAAQEALPFPRLCTLAGVEVRPDLERLLREAWRPFLAVEGTAGDRRYRLYHASLREFLDGRADLERLTEVERSLTEELAAATQQAHARIADRYLAAWSGLEAGLPGLREPGRRDLDGGYGLRHLAAHLEGAGRGEDLHRLLRVEWVHEEEVPYTCPGPKERPGQLPGQKRTHQRRRHENAWYATKEAVGDTDGFLTDVARAWGLVEEPPTAAAATPSPLSPGGRGEGAGERGEDIALQCRYALITASLNSLAKNIPPQLLAALVEKKEWPPAQGLAYARQAPDAGQRAEALVKLAPHLSQDLFSKALAVVQQIEWTEVRAEALAGLAPSLERDETLLQGAWTIARQIEDRDDRIKALAGLAPYMPEPEREQTLQEVLEATSRIADERERVSALVKLIPHLPDRQQGEAVKKARKATQGILWPEDRIQALREIATCPALTESERESLWQEALSTVRAIEEEEWKAAILRTLAPHSPEALQEEALSIASNIERVEIRIRTLADLFPHLSEALRAKAVQVAQAAVQETESLEDNVLKMLARHWAEQGDWHEASRAVRSIRKGPDQVAALLDLVPHLPNETWKQRLLARAWAVARNTRDAKEQVEAFLALASCSYVSDEQRERAVREALTAARGIEREEQRAQALASLAPYLPETLLREALDVARTIRDARIRAGALLSLIEYLPASQYAPVLEEALAAARDLREGNPQDEEFRDRALGLAQQGRSLEALAAAQRIQDAHLRIETLLALSHHLPPKWEEQALQAIQKAASVLRRRTMPVELPQTQVRRLARQGYITEALVAARQIRDAPVRARTLLHLATSYYLSKSARQQVLREALTAAREVRDPRTRVEVLLELAPRLPPSPRKRALQEALATVQGIGDRGAQARTLIELARHLAGGERGAALQEALAAAREITNEYRRAQTLADIAPHLSAQDREKALQNAWQATRNVQDPYLRVNLLAQLALHLSEPRQQESESQQQESKPRQQEALQEAVETASQIEDPWQQADALLRLLSHNFPEATLREGVQQKALSAAGEIEDKSLRAQTLRVLAAHLPPPQREEALWEAWEAARGIEDPWIQASVVWELLHLSYLPAALRQQILWEMGEEPAFSPWETMLWEVARAAPTLRGNGSRRQFDRVLRAIARLMAGQGRWLEALSTIRGISDAATRAEELRELALFHPPEALRRQALLEAMMATEEIVRPTRRVQVLARLIPHLPEPEQEHALRNALDALREEKDAERQAEALEELASSLPQMLPREDLKETLRIARDVENTRARGKMLSALASPLANWAKRNRNAVHDLWRETLHTLARRTRRDLLSDLSALAPLIYALGGPEAIVGTFQAIQDVGRWWP